MRRSYIVSLVRRAKESVRDEARGPAEPNAGGIERFASYYRALLREIEATGAVPMPMTFAIAYPGSFDDADRPKIERSFGDWLRDQHMSPALGKAIIARQNEVVTSLARDDRVPLVDVAAAVEPDRTHFIDVCHLTVEGNHRIAEALATALIPLIDRRAASADG
jgi:hypothetical protein